MASVQDTAEEEPLAVSEVCVTATAANQLTQCWEELSVGDQELMGSLQHFDTFIREVLSFDFRSAHQRISKSNSEVYRVDLFGLTIEYTILSEGVILRAIRCAPTSVTTFP